MQLNGIECSLKPGGKVLAACCASGICFGACFVIGEDDWRSAHLPPPMTCYQSIPVLSVSCGLSLLLVLTLITSKIQFNLNTGPLVTVLMTEGLPCLNNY